MEVHNPVARAAAKLRQHGHETEAVNLEQYAKNVTLPNTNPADALDAARYRWLRTEQAYYNGDENYGMGPVGSLSPILITESCRGTAISCTGAELDDAVDAAMTAAQAPQFQEVTHG